MQIRQADEVDLDIVQLAVWYESQREGLSKSFLAAYQSAIDRILENPFAYRAINAKIRRYFIREFKIWVVYGAKEDAVEILVVVHAQRSMDSWIHRISDYE